MLMLTNSLNQCGIRGFRRDVPMNQLISECLIRASGSEYIHHLLTYVDLRGELHGQSQPLPNVCLIVAFACHEANVALQTLPYNHVLNKGGARGNFVGLIIRICSA